VDVGVGVSVGVEVAKKATMVLAMSALTNKPMPQSKLLPPSSKVTRKQPNAEKDDFAERGRAVGTERCGEFIRDKRRLKVEVSELQRFGVTIHPSSSSFLLCQGPHEIRS
jgi:hypothetical protein